MKTLLVLVLLAALRCGAEDTNQPVTLRYVKPTELEYTPTLPPGVVFWATNHTTNTVLVALSAVEVKAGSNWVTQPLGILGIPRHLNFTPVVSLSFGGRDVLGPRTTGYTRVQLTVPTGTTWRVKAIVERKLSGAENTIAAIKAEPRLVNLRLRTGNTNIPVNPFNTKMTFYDKPIPVVSQVVTNELAGPKEP